MTLMSHRIPDMLLVEAMEMTKAMLVMAKKGDWEDVSQLESRRQAMLLEGIDSEVKLDRNSQAGKQIREILEVDQEIQKLVKTARDGVRDELLQMNRSRSQIKQYQGL